MTSYKLQNGKHCNFYILSLKQSKLLSYDMKLYIRNKDLFGANQSIHSSSGSLPNNNKLNVAIRSF